jgi:hypothetical protein
MARSRTKPLRRCEGAWRQPQFAENSVKAVFAEADRGKDEFFRMNDTVSLLIFPCLTRKEVLIQIPPSSSQ